MVIMFDMLILSLLEAIYTVLVFKASTILLYVDRSAFLNRVETDLLFAISHRDKRKSKIALATLGIVLTMYLMDLSLWMIDVRNIVTDLRLTFITSSSESLADRYAEAQDTILRLEIVEDVLYSYMVRHQQTPYPLSLRIWQCHFPDLARRCDHHIESVRLLAEWQGTVHFNPTLRCVPGFRRSVSKVF